MKIAIVQFPGSNCERETILAVKRAKMQPVPFLWNESPAKLEACNGYIIVGGFSYEDRCRAGVIASLDPIMEIIAKQSDLGKPILGICNGAQILVEKGLVPGLKNNEKAIALSANKRIKDGKILGTGFYNAWVHLKPVKKYQSNAFTRHLSTEYPICIPSAHAEGRFILANGLYDTLLTKNIAILQYCDTEGTVTNEFPVNPNGSENNIAAISNARGNVMAIMPHPERSVNGDAIFNSMHDYLKEKNLAPSTTPEIKLTPEPYVINNYHKPNNAIEWHVNQIITDNEALSVQQALRSLNLSVNVSRQIHWEIYHHEEKDEEQKLLKLILSTYELFNPSKERLILPAELPQKNTLALLVRDKENLLGQQKKETLKNRFELNKIDKITHGVLWRITCDDIKTVTDAILSNNILFNRYAHDCYIY